MKKIVVFIALLGLENIFAESIVEQNKLLEKDQKTIVANDYVNVNKNGFFLGLEAELGDIKYSRYTTNAQALSSAIFNYANNNITFNGGLLVGYQHYFGAETKHGIKISSHFYSGAGYSFKNTTHSKDTVEFPLNGGSHTVESDYNFSHTFIPIKFGLDVKYLYDFLQKDDHILGFGIGFGYEVDYYFSSISLINDNFKLDGMPDSTTANDVRLETSDNLNHGAYYTIGLHYLFKKHHLFEFNYRFGGIIGLNGGKQDIKYYSKNTANPAPVDSENSITGKYHFATQSYITISYAYKF